MTAKNLYLPIVLALPILNGITPQLLRAQVAPSAFSSSFSLTAGGMTSAFQFRDVGNVVDKTGGTGTYVDLNLYHGLGVEAEARWQRFYVFRGINRDNYLAGPRAQFRTIWRTSPYLKVLGGFTNISFGNFGGSGSFGAVAIGGGLDFHLSHRIRVRIVDAEYQYEKWPASLGPHEMPYG